MLKTTKIECYSVPAQGHAIPLLRIAQILQKKNPHFQLVFISSSYYVQKMKNQFPHLKMEGIEDGLTQNKYYEEIQKHKPFTLTKFVFTMHQDYFNRRKKHPQMMICNIFSKQAIEYAQRNQIKFIIHQVFTYQFVQEILNFPNHERSFGLGGFTINYPKIFNTFQILGVSEIQDIFRSKSKWIISSAIGLEPPTSIPSHHTFIGLLNNRQSKVTTLDEDLQLWMEEWKHKGKNKFLYVAFGSVLNISQKLAISIKDVIEKAGYPTIWSLKNDFQGKIASELIYSRKWLPQQAILSMPEVRCFISHCGWGSLTEAVISQTPLVCIPGFFDQINNARIVEEKKIGIKLYEPLFNIGPPPVFDPKLDAQSIAKAVGQVMEKQKYMLNIKKVSKICKTYKTDELLDKTVHETLQLGDDHLIDKNYEKATSRSTSSTFKLILFIIIMMVLWAFRKKIMKMFNSLG